MRLGLFGGSFDPIHLGHLILAENCRDQFRLDAVWFIPAATPPHKQVRPITDGELRAAMVEAAIAGQPEFSLCCHELEKGGVNYTVDTLRFIHQTVPDAELFLIVGGDMLLDLPHWREAAEVCRLATPVAAVRPGEATELQFEALAGLVAPARLREMANHLVKMPVLGISSTDIRRRVAEGRTIRYLVPPAVEALIEAHTLYRDP